MNEEKISQETEETKMKPKPKAGRVVRLTPDLVQLIAAERKENETVPATIRRLLSFSGDICYVLPSDLHQTVEDARGVAIIRAIRTKKPERPMKVRLLSEGAEGAGEKE